MHDSRTSWLHSAMIQTLVCVFSVVLFSSAQASWFTLAGGDPGDAPVMAVNHLSAHRIEVEVDIPGMEILHVAIEGGLYSRVLIPGSVHLIETGYPELPFLARAIRLAGQGTPRMEILESIWEPVPAHPPVPSRGSLSRDVDPDATPYVFAAVYAQKSGVWPHEPAELGRPFLVRDHRGVSLRVHPVRWNSAEGHLEALVRLRLSVVTEGVDGPNESTMRARPGGRSFDPVLRAVFGGSVTTDKTGDVMSQDTSEGQERLLIVTHQSLRPSVSDLVNWKMERGYEVEVLGMNELGGQAEGIHAAVHQRFHGEEGLTHLLLIGDATLVPTNAGTYHGAPSDGMYGLVAGDDLFADVLVSRLPARNRSELDLMIARVVSYERDPRPDGSWYTHGAGIASDEGVPADFQRVEWLRDSMLSGDYTQVQRIYQSQGGSREMIADAVNDGVSLINYMGHGSGTGWLSVYFNNGNVHQLTNTTAWPWIIDVACHNGDFVRLQSECFAEAWLRAQHDGQPAGAVAMIAASSQASWVPPTVMQSTIIDRLIEEGETQIGVLLAAGVAEVLVQYEGTHEGHKLMEQYNLFGDGTMLVRSRQPDHLIVSHPEAVGFGRPVLSVAMPVGARAVLFDDQGILAWADQTGLDPVDLTPSRDLQSGGIVRLTVTASNALPYRAELPVQNLPTGTIDVLPDLVKRLDNWPNPFNPQTTVGFTLARSGQVHLSVLDPRGRLIRLLVREHLPEGNHRIVWDGRDSAGRDVASGVYLALLQTQQGEQAHKMVLAR